VFHIGGVWAILTKLPEGMVLSPAMKRRFLLGFVLSFGLAGCGGGGGGALTQLVSTGGNGQVTSARLGPPSGTAFLGRTQTFQMAWTPALPPPPVAEVGLMRYQEARGGETRAVTGQRIGVLPAAGALTWDIRPISNLIPDGVYFLELTTPGQTTKRACYLVGASANPSGGGATINTGTTSGQLASVQFTPGAGGVYIPRSSNFQLTWPSGSTPPPSFSVTLWRYKEARGLNGRVVEEQPIADPTRTGSSFVWAIRRRDSQELDPGGVYFLELRAPGETDVRAAYIVSVEQ
jgi:hypothetical protein